jgi:hypothetical protein
LDLTDLDGSARVGVQVADLHTMSMRTGDDRMNLTFYWPEMGQWEGADFRVCVE